MPKIEQLDWSKLMPAQPEKKQTHPTLKPKEAKVARAVIHKKRKPRLDAHTGYQLHQQNEHLRSISRET